MIRIFLSTLFTAALLPVYLNWSRGQAERQIDKMQAAAFDNPGAESPITPSVLGGGVALLLVHFVSARLLRLNPWQTLVSLFVGLTIGGGIFLRWMQERAK